MTVNIRGIIKSTLRQLETDTLYTVAENIDLIQKDSTPVYDVNTLSNIEQPPVVTPARGWVTKVTDSRRDFTETDRDTVRVILTDHYDVILTTNDELVIHYSESGESKRYSIYKVKPSTAELVTVVFGIEVLA